MRDGMGTDVHPLVLCEGPEGVVKMSGLDPTGREVVAIHPAGEIAVPAHELLATTDRFFEWQVLQAMKRIVMDEGPHWPVLGNDLAGELHNAAQLHPSGFDVDRAGYLFHV